MIHEIDGSRSVVMSVGGSLIYPDTASGLDRKFLADLRDFICRHVSENPKLRFFLVAGGGAIARHYQDAVSAVVGHSLPDKEKDWIGIHATRQNAQALRAIFSDIAFPRLLKHYEIVWDVENPVAIAAGWKPGWSTDYCAVRLARQYGATTIFNLSNIQQLCDKDPKKSPDAKPIDAISWKKFRLMVGNEWVPGMNAPFDPIASREAQELGKKVVIMRGNDFTNLERYFNRESFIGTVIS